MGKLKAYAGEHPKENTGHLCGSCVFMVARKFCKKLNGERKYYHRSCSEYVRLPSVRKEPKAEAGPFPKKVMTEWVDRPCMQCRVKPYERPVDSDYHMCVACRERVNRRATLFADDASVRCE